MSDAREKFVRIATYCGLIASGWLWAQGGMYALVGCALWVSCIPALAILDEKAERATKKLEAEAELLRRLHAGLLKHVKHINRSGDDTQ